jgi:hypothetical protein
VTELLIRPLRKLLHERMVAPGAQFLDEQAWLLCLSKLNDPEPWFVLSMRRHTGSTQLEVKAPNKLYAYEVFDLSEGGYRSISHGSVLYAMRLTEHQAAHIKRYGCLADDLNLALPETMEPEAGLRAIIAAAGEALEVPGGNYRAMQLLARVELLDARARAQHSSQPAKQSTQRSAP